MRRAATPMGQDFIGDESGLDTGENYPASASFPTSPRRDQTKGGDSIPVRPEKLIAAAHAAWLLMAPFGTGSRNLATLKLSGEVRLQDISVQGWMVTSSQVALVASISGLGDNAFTVSPPRQSELSRFPAVKASLL